MFSSMHVIKEEKRKIDRFIQLKPKVQKKDIDSNPEVLKAILSKNQVYRMR